jgi:hypothetical protein
MLFHLVKSFLYMKRISNWSSKVCNENDVLIVHLAGNNKFNIDGFTIRRI